MRANLLFYIHSFLDAGNLENYNSSLAELLLTKDLARSKGDLVFKPGGWDDLLLNQLINDFDENERAFTPAIIQKLRMLFDSKAIALGLNPETIEELNEILDDKPNAFLGVTFENENHFFIRNRNDWYRFHQITLGENPPTINDFCQALEPYFRNLHFNRQSIPIFLPTLHRGSHIPVMRTIVHHLSSLDNRFHSLFLQYRAEGLPRVCERFEIEMNNNPIAFGCSTDTGGVESLEIPFIDPESTIQRNIYCDPHTKIWGYLEDNIHDDGDRIYFSQPFDDFIIGKILIARIGRHR